MSACLLPFHRRVFLLFREHARALGVVAVASGLFGAVSSTAGVLSMIATGLILACPVLLAGGGLAGPETAQWIQKPVGALRFELLRLWEAWAASTGLVLVMSLLAGMAGGIEANRDLLHTAVAGVAGACLVPLLLGAVTFGFSAWLGRAGRVTAVAWFAAAGVLGVMAFIASQPPASPVDPALPFFTAARVLVGSGALLELVEMALPPFAAFPDIADFSNGLATPGALLRSVAWIASYSAAWVLVGVAGIRWRLHTGRVARARG